MINILDAWAEYMTATGAAHQTVLTRLRSVHSLMHTSGIDDPLKLNRMHVLTWLARPRAQWTKVTYWASVKALDEWLVEFDIAELQLTKGIPRPKAPSAVARPITDEVIDALLKLNLPPRPSAYVRLALFEAMRVHEIAKIQGEEFDHASGWLMINGKGGTTAPVPIHPEIAELATTMPEIGFWFPARDQAEGHVTPISVSRTIGAALRAVGSKATAHQLRDTAATRFQREVKDIRLTQAFLRHKVLSSTMKYTAVNDAALFAAVRAARWGRQPDAA